MVRVCALLVVILTACSFAQPTRYTRDTIATRPPNAPKPSWSHPIEAPFVDVFHLGPQDQLLVGGVGWNRGSARFVQKNLSLFDSATGARLWTTKRPAFEDGAYTLVGIAAGKVVLQVSQVERTRWLAYGLTDGVKAWEHAVNAPAIASVSRDADLVIATKALVQVLAVTDGKRRWEHTVVAGGTRSVPTVTGDQARLCIVARDVACVEPSTGKELWRKPFKDEARVVHVATVQGLLMVATDKAITTWAIADGTARWSRAIEDAGLARLEVADEVAYAVSLDAEAQTARVRALRTTSGEVRWTSESLPPPRGPMTVMTDTLYLSTPSVLVAVDAKTGVTKERAAIPFSLFEAMRGPDTVLVDDTRVTVVTERGAAIYAKNGLTLQAVAPLAGANTWGNARYLLKYQRHPNAVAGTSVMLAYPQQGVSVGVIAHYRLGSTFRAMNDLPMAVSETQAAQHAERVQANLALVNAAVLGLGNILLAIGREGVLQEATDSLLARYATTAADLRLEGTPSGYALAGNNNALLIYDPTRKASATFDHSSEHMMDWQHIAVITPDGQRVIGAHVNFDQASRATELNDVLSRHDLSVESFDLAGVAWQTASLPPENPVLADVRNGRLRSIRDRFTYRACHIADALPPDLNLTLIYEAAVVGNNTSILRELEDNGAGLISAAARATAAGMGFVEAAAELQAADTRLENDLVLGLANAFGKLEQARAALDRGANPNGRASNTTQSCYTVPLAESKTVAMTELLLAKGAAINLRDVAGHTPLDKRIAAKDDANIKLLRSRGAKTASEL